MPLHLLHPITDSDMQRWIVVDINIIVCLQDGEDHYVIMNMQFSYILSYNMLTYSYATSSKTLEFSIPSNEVWLPSQLNDNQWDSKNKFYVKSTKTQLYRTLTKIKLLNSIYRCNWRHNAISLLKQYLGFARDVLPK